MERKKPGRKLEPASKRRVAWRRWTGFGNKTVWDWLQLLIVPLALAVIGLWFTFQQDARQQQIEEQRAESERKLENQRAQDVALQAYLDQVSHLLLEKDLRDSKTGSELRTLARARTLTTLGSIDADHKLSLLRFLYEADLINRPKPVINLDGANLRNVDLSGTDLSGGPFGPSNLRGISDLCVTRSEEAAPPPVGNSYGGCELGEGFITFHLSNLRGTDLGGTSLRGADLSWIVLAKAALRNADLSDASLHNALLVDAELYEANLRNANLSDANLTGANLTFADLTEATGLTKAELENQACTLDGAIMPDGSERMSLGTPINCEQKRAVGEDEENSGPP